MSADLQAQAELRRRRLVKGEMTEDEAEAHLAAIERESVELADREVELRVARALAPRGGVPGPLPNRAVRAALEAAGMEWLVPLPPDESAPDLPLDAAAVGNTYEIFAEVRHHERHCEDWEQVEKRCWKLVNGGDRRQMIGAALRDWADEIDPPAGPDGAE